jgi:hypothetical protein
MIESQFTFETKISRNGLTVPVINNIHLHSIYNPIKEAEAFADNIIQTLQNRNNILVLGLGYGYHIEQIAQRLAQFHDNYHIVILEPNTTLVDSFNLKRPFEDKNIQIVNSLDVDAVFSDINFVQFLRKKPAIVKHDTSYTLNKTFFTKFLKFQAPNNFDIYFNLLNKNAQNIFNTYNNLDQNFENMINQISMKNTITNADFLLLALGEIKKLNPNLTQGN